MYLFLSPGAAPDAKGCIQDFLWLLEVVTRRTGWLSWLLCLVMRLWVGLGLNLFFSIPSSAVIGLYSLVRASCTLDATALGAPWLRIVTLDSVTGWARPWGAIVERYVLNWRLKGLFSSFTCSSVRSLLKSLLADVLFLNALELSADSYEVAR